MPTVKLHTLIAAPIERCFDLTRSIDFHAQSYRESNERAIAGRTSGLIELGEKVTFAYRQYGVVHYRLEVEIRAFDRPCHFKDSFLSGSFFRCFDHHHRFHPHQGKTLMTDEFEFELATTRPTRALEDTFMAAYVRRSLARRNQHLVNALQSDGWRFALVPAGALGD